MTSEASAPPRSARRSPFFTRPRPCTRRIAPGGQPPLLARRTSPKCSMRPGGYVAIPLGGTGRLHGPPPRFSERRCASPRSYVSSDAPPPASMTYQSVVPRQGHLSRICSPGFPTLGGVSARPRPIVRGCPDTPRTCSTARARPSRSQRLIVSGGPIDHPAASHAAHLPGRRHRAGARRRLRTTGPSSATRHAVGARLQQPPNFGSRHTSAVSRSSGPGGRQRRVVTASQPPTSLARSDYMQGA